MNNNFNGDEIIKKKVYEIRNNLHRQNNRSKFFAIVSLLIVYAIIVVFLISIVIDFLNT